MKEATGELNTAVIVIISVGILAVFFFSYLWPILKGNFQKNSQCNKATCDCSKIETIEDVDYCTCHIGDDGEEFYCVYKG